MSWLSDKWQRNNGPIEAGPDGDTTGPFSDNSAEEITARTMRNFAFEINQALTAVDHGPATQADAVSLEDVDGNFVGTNVEDALAETVTSVEIRRIVKMTQGAYALLPIKDPETLYMLTS